MEIKSCNGACVTAIAKSPIDQKRKRRSIRLQGYDYSQAGAYYITMCTRNRECLFGNVVDGQIQLSEIGQIVQTVWNGLPQFYEGVELDAFVVMPNHVHGIIVIHAGVGAIHESPLPSKPFVPARIVDRRGMLLSKIIGRFKMVTAKQINALRESSGLRSGNAIITNTSSVTRYPSTVFDSTSQTTQRNGNLIGRIRRQVHSNGRGDS